MSKVSKIIILLGVVLIAGYFGTTYWIGSVTESAWRKQAAEMSAVTPGVEINVTAYNRSFFSATVATEVTLDIPQSEIDEPLSVEFNSRVAHGPLVFTDGRPALLMVNVDTSVTATSGPLVEVFAAIPEIQQLTFSEQVFFNLDYKGVGGLPAFERQFEDDSDQILVRFDGLKSEYSGSLKTKSLQATMSMPGVRVQSNSGDVNLELKKADAQIDIREALDAIYTGTTEMNLESLVLSGLDDGEPMNISLAGLQVGAVVDIVDGLISEEIVYRLDQVDVNGGLYGPASFDLVLSNLDAEVMSLIQNDLQQAQIAALQENSSDFSTQYINSLKQHLLPLVKKSPKLEIRGFNVNTPFGKFTSRGQVQIAGEQVMGIEPVMLLIAALTADADLEIDKSLLKQIGTQYLLQSMQGQSGDVSTEELELRAMQQAVQNIDGLLAANFLVDAGETYQLNAKFDRGSLYVNGKQMQ